MNRAAALAIVLILAIAYVAGKGFEALSGYLTWIGRADAELKLRRDASPLIIVPERS